MPPRPHWALSRIKLAARQTNLPVLATIRHALSALEAQAESSQAQVDLFAAPPVLSGSEPSAVEAALTALNPDEMSPRDALEALYALKKISIK